MTNDLYRKEAVDHSIRNLYGDVILTGPPGSWIVTLILISVMLIIGAGLLWVEIDDLALWRWLWMRAG